MINKIINFFSTLILMIITAIIGIFNPTPNTIPEPEKQQLSQLVESYMTQKYGEHQFKVSKTTKISNGNTALDKTNTESYKVYCTSNILETPIYINVSTTNDILYDDLINQCYFKYDDSYLFENELDKIKPVNAMKNKLYNDYILDFDSNCNEIKYLTLKLSIPNDYGKIPSLEQLKSDLNLYEISSFDYETNNAQMDENSYSIELENYLKSKFEFNWRIFIFKSNNNTYTIKASHSI